MMNDYSNTNSY